MPQVKGQKTTKRQQKVRTADSPLRGEASCVYIHYVRLHWPLQHLLLAWYNQYSKCILAEENIKMVLTALARFKFSKLHTHKKKK